MRLRPDRVGSRALALLVVTGAVGIGLAIHGYGRGGVTGTGGLGALASTSGSHGHTSSGTSAPASPAPARHSSPSTTKTSGAGSSTTNSSSSTAPAQRIGPLLSSTPYAQYAFQVYPGPETSQTRLATAGFKIQVQPRGGAMQLRVAATGSGQGAQTSNFAFGDHVYFIEASLGDDSGNLEYNFGDDGLVITDAQGHIVQ